MKTPTAAEALAECASYAPALQLDEDDYRTLAVIISTWLIEVREKRRHEAHSSLEA